MNNTYNTRYRSMLVAVFTLLLGTSAALAQWTSLPGYPGGLIWPQTAWLDGKLYSFGGIGIPEGGSFNQILTIARVWDGTSWSNIAPLQEGRFGGYAAAINGKIYIVGGQMSLTSAEYATTTLEYDPATNRYTNKFKIPSPVTQFAGTVVGDRIFLIGGLIVVAGQQVYTDSTLVYNATTNTWSQGSVAPYPGYYATATAHDNTIYLITGYNETYLDKAYKGTVSDTTITWTKIANYPIAMRRAASGFINGQLYVAGGVTADGPLSTTYRYDDNANTWNWFYQMPFATHDVNTMVGDGTFLYYNGGRVNDSLLKLTADNPAAIANLDQTDFLVALQAGTKRTINLAIQNRGVVDLNATISIPPTSPWLTASPPMVMVMPGQTRSMPLVLDAALLAVGTYQTTATLETNDANQAQIPISIRLQVVDSVVLQQTHVVIEEASADRCGDCPFGIDSLVSIKKEFGERAIILSYHGASSSDPMLTSVGADILASLGLTEPPRASIQRRTFPGDQAPMSPRSQWKIRTGNILAMMPTAPVAITLDSMSFNQGSSLVNARVRLDIAEPILLGSNTSLNLTAVVTQDSINYPQVAYPPEGGVVELDPYFQRYVVRYVWPNATGFAIDIPPSAIQDGILQPGTTLTQDVSFTVSTPPTSDPRLAFKPGKSNLVVFAHLNQGSILGEILQGVETKLFTPTINIVVDTTKKSIAPSQTAVFTSNVSNVSSDTLEITVTRTDNVMPDPTWKNWFCINQDCGTEATDELMRTLLPGETANVTVHVTGSEPGTGVVGLSVASGTERYYQPFVTSISTSDVTEHHDAEHELRIHDIIPNPSSGLTRLEYVASTAGHLTLEVFDINGNRMMAPLDGDVQAGTHTLMLNTEKLASGVYSVVLSNNMHRVVRLLSVVK